MERRCTPNFYWGPARCASSTDRNALDVSWCIVHTTRAAGETEPAPQVKPVPRSCREAITRVQPVQPEWTMWPSSSPRPLITRRRGSCKAQQSTLLFFMLAPQERQFTARRPAVADTRLGVEWIQRVAASAPTVEPQTGIFGGFGHIVTGSRDGRARASSSIRA